MESLTVGELIEKLKKMPKKAKVYMVTDRSNDNWNEDNDCYKQVHGIEYVTREVVFNDDGWDNESEINVLLEIECE